MTIDYAKLAAAEQARQRKQVVEDTLARVREEILQIDDEQAGDFCSSRPGNALLQERVRVHYTA
jgi:hypothetical protein